MVTLAICASGDASCQLTALFPILTQQSVTRGSRPPASCASSQLIAGRKHSPLNHISLLKSMRLLHSLFILLAPSSSRSSSVSTPGSSASAGGHPGVRQRTTWPRQLEASHTGSHQSSAGSAPAARCCAPDPGQAKHCHKTAHVTTHTYCEPVNPICACSRRCAA